MSLSSKNKLILKKIPIPATMIAMTLTQRRLLFYFFILLFLAIVPVVLLYATGRTVNWRRWELQKTASINIKSEPSGAEIFLNGQRPSTLLHQLFGQKTPAHSPAKISDLTPGEYSLRLEADGYFPWEEKITIHAGEVFNAESIRLFRNEKPTLLKKLDPNTSNFPSPDGQTIISLASKKLTIFSVQKKQNIDVVIPENLTDSKILWSKDKDLFLYANRLLISNNGEILFDFKNAKRPASELLRWDRNTNNRLYGLSSQGLFRFDLSSKTFEEIQEAKGLLHKIQIKDFEVEGRQIYILVTAPNNELIAFSSNDPQRFQTTQLPNGDYTFLRADNPEPLIYEPRSRNLYVIEQPLPLISPYRVTRIANDFSLGHWEDNKLMYATPFELRLQEGNAEARFISRLGENVIDTILLPKSPYALYATSTSLTAIPLSGFPANPATKLLNAENIQKILAASEHEVLYIAGTNASYGLFSLPS